MSQASVYLNGEEIMRDVLLVENLPEGVRLSALFEPVRVVPAALRRIDLNKHRVILESLEVGTQEAATSEVDKLRVLIPRWMEHNAEHAEEFRRRAQQAGEAAGEILTAADAMQRVNTALSGALEKLGGLLSQQREFHSG
jgi:predicted RNA-binding protein